MSTPEELQRQFTDAETVNNEYQKLHLKVNAVYQYLLEMTTGGDHEHDDVPAHDHSALGQEVEALGVRLDALKAEVAALAPAEEDMRTPEDPGSP